MELMLASLVGCAGSTVDSVLAKMRFEVAALNVVADAERSDRVPRVYTDAVLEFHIASEAPEERLARAVAVTERTCSASVMLAQVLTLTPRLVHIRQVEARDTRELRRRVLRPHQSVDELAAEEDSAATWFAAVLDGDVVGTVSLSPEDSPDELKADVPYRLRSMAISEPMRGRGLGAVLLGAAVAHVRAVGGDAVWCSARAAAAAFYRAAGFVESSGEYEVAHIGPHVRMALRL
jgi:GNAT superfamily N-acetyltransferase